jgi:hypothetical protein
MQFRLLGTLEFAEQNVAAALGGLKRRCLPATLLGDPPPAPTVPVARGAGQATIAPDGPGARFRWSLAGAGS